MKRCLYLRPEYSTSPTTYKSSESSPPFHLKSSKLPRFPRPAYSQQFDQYIMSALHPLSCCLHQVALHLITLHLLGLPSFTTPVQFHHHNFAASPEEPALNSSSPRCHNTKTLPHSNCTTSPLR
ncbi:uncharacterized protein K444DRAFT_359992 [Hyaloscypha bicolor E]|uniref:Uncharacterized protein n=1 Tax=Hyaloscypha bicolor E TaxID=1095630 RepID=A0A2J6TG34_9HELO|nr:uncharacterized protein K444DRAFT_359992 [Hyaloscypha bicolor E]PMD61977.1 hypothetical protein K444DRAFT_359992 [Hyaloscypha bicolor E]